MLSSESKTLSASVFFLLDATYSVWIKHRRKGSRKVGTLKDEIENDWAITNVKQVVLVVAIHVTWFTFGPQSVLMRKQDRLALFPFAEGMGGLEYHTVEVIASHFFSYVLCTSLNVFWWLTLLCSNLQRYFITSWLKEHSDALKLKPYRKHTVEECVQRVEDVLKGRVKKLN